MTGLTRDQIIDRAAQAIVGCGFDRSVLPIENTDKWAAAAVDAVLRLLADRLEPMAEGCWDEAKFWSTSGVDEQASQWRGRALGCEAVTKWLRSLLPEGDDQ
jgi:hypothetical protein